MKRLPNRPSSLLIEGVKKPPIDIIRREPRIATGYAEVVYTRGRTAGNERRVPIHDAPAHSPTGSPRTPSYLTTMAKSTLTFVQGVVVGIALLAATLLVHQELQVSATREAVVPADTQTRSLDSASIPAAPASNANALSISAQPSGSQVPGPDASRQQLEQELHELQAVNHLLTAQVEDLRRKLVITKSDLSTMTSTKDYYVQKVKEIEDSLLDQKRQNWVAQRALGRALDKMNP